MDGRQCFLYLRASAYNPTSRGVMRVGFYELEEITAEKLRNGYFSNFSLFPFGDILLITLFLVEASSFSPLIRCRNPPWNRPALPKRRTKRRKNRKWKHRCRCLEVEESYGLIQNVELKETVHSIRSSVNKFASLMKKPSHRRSPPLNWFPRKKTDSFLKRKIRLLQEGGGMNMSLVETLGNANPHYSRIAREKIAAQEAARRAMEARKAAMVEASWCRILQAARIQSKDAESKLEKAEVCAAKAFEEAKLMGVMMFDKPDCPRKSCEVSSSATGGKSAHTVTASFETEFEVDREVAAAVKKAFILLANCSSSSNKEEFRDLLRKIRQNPDDYGALTASLQCEFDHSSELEPELHATIIGSEISEKHNEVSHRKSTHGILLECHEDNNSNLSEDLVNIMVDRLKALQEDELSSLATIVATCGFNAALLEMQNSHDHENKHDAQEEMRRRSNVNHSLYASQRKKEDITNVPSLDKFLVKHVSRLEREVQQAQLSKKDDDVMAEFDEHVSDDRTAQLKQTRRTSQYASDLGSILIKHVSKLEREIQDAKNSQKKNPKNNHEEECIIKLSEDLERPDVKFLEMISLASADAKEEKENLKCKSKSLTKEKNQAMELREITNGNISKSQEARAKLETRKSFSCQRRQGINDFQQASLDKILVKPVHWLEREKMKATEKGNMPSVKKIDTKLEKIEPLDEILVKHQSKLEKTKLAAVQEGTDFVMQKRRQHVEKIESLDEILVKHQSKLERVKLEATQNSENSIKNVTARRKAREKELQEAWGGLSLGNSLQPHLSKLEKDKVRLLPGEELNRKRKSVEGSVESDAWLGFDFATSSGRVVHVQRPLAQRSGLGVRLLGTLGLHIAPPLFAQVVRPA
ncbi:hypothetical protein IEQ34_011932 [Dendrobium chrysotoxum]|uniref:Uncharacterized protein n=1 Tax=Dendrobium chrysotoxum TaxID=161865 RepID=A0AAV7GTU6_DENCH|nr:hypothetical protein IEQ34_011932 [Dendrobium chrysotoxum]